SNIDSIRFGIIIWVDRIGLNCRWYGSGTQFFSIFIQYRRNNLVIKSFHSFAADFEFKAIIDMSFSIFGCWLGICNNTIGHFFADDIDEGVGCQAFAGMCITIDGSVVMIDGGDDIFVIGALGGYL